jgi:RNA polymerase sigma-70 factor, ECF subfamily
MIWETDHYLIKRVLAGKEDAFGKLYDRHAPKVYGLLKRLTGNETEADDLLQETFINGYRSLAQWRGQGKFSTYLCGIACRLYKNARRKAQGGLGEQTDELNDEIVATTPTSDPFAQCTQREMEGALEKAIAALPESCREVFIMVRMEEMSYREVAEVLEVPLGTVQSRLFRATQLLQLRLSEYLPERKATHTIKETPIKEKGVDHV